MEEGKKNPPFLAAIRHKMSWCRHPSQIGRGGWRKILHCNFPHGLLILA